MNTVSPHAHDSNIPLKHCNGCNRDLPATRDYFSPQRDAKDGLTYRCKRCHRDYAEQYHKTHREEGRQYTSRYLQEHREEVLVKKRKYNDAHREERRIAKAVWHEQNREQQRLYSERYNAEHREERLAYYRKRREEHREELNARHRQYIQTDHARLVRRATENKRRARKLAAPGFYTADDITRMFTNQKGRCYYCNVKFGKGKRAYHVDHVVPVSRGGSNAPDNLVLACEPCNLRKTDKLLHEWEEGGRLL